MSEEIIIINGEKYLKNDPRISKDYISNEYFVKADTPHFEIVVDIERSDLRYDENEDIYFFPFVPVKEHVVIRPGNTISTMMNKFLFIRLLTVNRDEINVYFLRNGDIINFIKTYDLVRGNNLTQYYFFRKEMPYIDKKLKYRKFNNIYKKVEVEDVLGREVSPADSCNLEYHKLRASVKKKNIEMGVDSVSHNELEGIKYTLGHEIETISGRLEEEAVEGLNLAAVHDGSLRARPGEDPMGGEYLTGILYGDAGFKQLYDICRVLNEFCTLNHQCGNHVHIGSLQWGKEDVVYAYLLGELIEKEMYSMLPKSRRNNSYCRKLRPILTIDIPSLKKLSDKKLEYEVLIDTLYGKVFREVSGGYNPSRDFNSSTNHPKGSKCGYDKDSQRYCWLNFVTLLFNTKGGGPNSLTLEIRSHSATMNYKKIKNWAKIWVAFCNFVDNHKKAIREGEINVPKFGTLPISLETMCLVAYPKSGEKLVAYIQERKETFKVAEESIDYPAEASSAKSIKEVILSE